MKHVQIVEVGILDGLAGIWASFYVSIVQVFIAKWERKFSDSNGAFIR
jgi:hypothetical protein